MASQLKLWRLKTRPNIAEPNLSSPTGALFSMPRLGLTPSLIWWKFDVPSLELKSLRCTKCYNPGTRDKPSPDPSSGPVPLPSVRTLLMRFSSSVMRLKPKTGFRVGAVMVSNSSSTFFVVGDSTLESAAFTGRKP